MLVLGFCLCYWPFWGRILAVDVLPQREKYLPDYNIYHNISQTEKDLKSIASLYPDFIRIEWMYRSRNDASQLVTHITNFSFPSSGESSNEGLGQRKNLSPKVLVLFSYGEHAREFFPVESCFHLLKNLTDGLKGKLGSYEETFTRSVLRRFDIYVIVMANPDGRSYIESSHNFCWRGTSSGVDLNRNFDWQFAKPGSSNNPEDEEYRGPLPFSEPECNVYIHLTSLMHFDAFISFHSGIRRIYMPFADTASKAIRRIPHNNHHMEVLSTRLSSVTQYQFKFGKAYDLNLYTADGTIFDYMAGVKQIPFSLAVELWANEEHTGLSCFDEFNPPSHNLQAEVEALHPLYVELFSYLDVWKQQTQKTDSPFVNEVPSFMEVRLAEYVAQSQRLIQDIRLARNSEQSERAIHKLEKLHVEVQAVVEEVLQQNSKLRERTHRQTRLLKMQQKSLKSWRSLCQN